MVEEGLFKKRIRENIDVSKPLCFAMEDWVDEAKKEFPFASYGDNLLNLEDCRRLLGDRLQWFVKWFGEK